MRQTRASASKSDRSRQTDAGAEVSAGRAAAVAPSCELGEAGSPGHPAGWRVESWDSGPAAKGSPGWRGFKEVAPSESLFGGPLTGWRWRGVGTRAHRATQARAARS